MELLSKLTLKGHFEDLRKDLITKGDIKVQGDHLSLEGDSLNKLLELLIKAVAIIEDVHQADGSLLGDDQASDYREMISVLNLYGISYKGLPEIMDLEEGAPPLKMPEKKPMQKARKSLKDNSDQSQKTG